MAEKPETLFKKCVMHDLSLLPNTWFTKIQQTVIRGIPDIIACIRGHFVVLELKTDIGRLDKLQAYNLATIKNCGGKSFVAMPSNWKDIFMELKNLAQE